VSYSLRIAIPRLPPLQAAGTTGTHWAKRYREKRWWTHQVHWHARFHGLPPEPLTRATVRITRCSASEPDADNLAASAKFPLDALVAARVLADDNPENLELRLDWEKALRGRGELRIEVSG
jgi:hypothetical protein